MNSLYAPNVKPDGVKTSDASLSPALYVVPTPIGNLRDITLRALDILSGCDRIYAEDTRVTAKLLQAFGLSKPVSRYDEHTHDKSVAEIIAAVQRGERIVLVSDAGTPAISDPGQYLVKACRDAGADVIALPGASAVITALSGAGLPTDRFCFVGFLSNKTTARQNVLHDYAARPETLVLFESASRIADLVADIGTVMGERPVAIARELTKKFEQYLFGTPQQLLQQIADHSAMKGEMVVLISAATDQDDISTDDIDALLKNALAQHSVRDAVEIVAKATGLKKQHVYQQALKLNDPDS
ncbi:MAG TPA: 16S rRNA (cytidine(1402)-2'-O)-methyltransferase [Alphaproteobacteria bacterium]